MGFLFKLQKGILSRLWVPQQDACAWTDTCRTGKGNRRAPGERRAHHRCLSDGEADEFQGERACATFFSSSFSARVNSYSADNSDNL